MNGLRRSATLLIAAALVAGACTGDEQEPEAGPDGAEIVTLDFWVFEEFGVNEIEMITSAFEAANPNVRIETTTFPEGNYDVKVDTAIAAGRPPDLIITYGPQYWLEGLLLPLNDMIAEKGIDVSTFSQAIVQGPGEFSCAWEGTIYCLGSYQAGAMMFYNKGMFDAAGIPYPEPYPAMSVEEFVDIACRLSDPENQIWGAAYQDPVFWLPWETLVSEDGRTATGYVNGPTTVQAYDSLARAVSDDCAPSLNVLDPNTQGTDFFISDQIAMIVADFSLKKVENAGVDYGAAIPPTPSGLEPYFNVFTDGIAVLEGSEHPDEAKEFIAFLATEGGRIRFEAGGESIPLDNALAEELNWAQGIQGREEMLEVLTHARPPVFIPNLYDTVGPIYDVFGVILTGETTAQEALDDIAPDIQEDLDRAWRIWDEEHG
jgi:multiple sugar transport system substrate-binding protein